MLSQAVCSGVLCCAVWCQDADWEYNEDAADDDLDQGASDEEGLADDPGYRKQLGEHTPGVATAHGREEGADADTSIHLGLPPGLVSTPTCLWNAR
jgi:hypothetical protein